MANDTTQFIINIQELICLLNNDFDNFKSILDQIVTEVIKNPKHTDAYVTFIKSQLSDAVTRKRGLILLRSFLPFCSNEVLEEEAIAWLNNSLKNCKHETTIHDDAYKVIKPLLEICYSSPDLNRSVTSGTLNKIIENITKIHYNSEDSVNALKCLETCLRIYSGSCLPFKTTIENFILTFVDCSTSSVVIRLAGRCFHALQQIGGGGTKGINHKEAWKNQQLNLCATIHSLMDELFESILELGEYTQPENVAPLMLPKLPTGDKNKLTFCRIINLIAFLQEMLLGAFPVAKSVYPNVILILVTRGLSITRITFGDQIINDAINMSSNLYSIHKHLLRLLQALIVCLGCDLIPYASTICKLIMNNLKLTKPKDAGNVKAFCELRTAAYQTLSLWITTAKAASYINTFSDSFISAIINDITPYSTELNLTIQYGTSKNLSKNAKKRMRENKITQSNVAKNYTPIHKKPIFSSNVYQNKICLEALNILETILINCGHLLKPLTHKQLQEFVIKTLFIIQRGNALNPYDDIKCRIGLYKTLTTLVTNHQWNMSPPIEYAIILLSKGQADSNPDISFVCSTALSNLNSFIHPPFASLQFPLDLDNLRSELNLDEEKNVPSPILAVESDEEIEDTEMVVEESSTNENIKIFEQDLPVTENVEESSNQKENVNIECTEDESVEIAENNANIVTKTDNKTCDNSSESSTIIMEQLISDDEPETIKIPDDNIEENVIKINDENNEENVVKINDNIEENVIQINDDNNEENVIKINDNIEENVIKINDDNIEENVSQTKETQEKKTEDVIDLMEEDMLSSFVDVVND